jgi:hypothetical protein
MSGPGSLELLFAVTESAFSYFAATEAYLHRHGKPVAFYSDKHSICRVNREGSTASTLCRTTWT